MRDHVSPREVAEAIGVSESSLKRWVDRGALPTARTAGGHRRIPLAAALEFIRREARVIEKPEALGLPASLRTGPASLAEAAGVATTALMSGDEETLRGVALKIYLAGHGLPALFDDVLSLAFRRLGDRWQHGQLEVFEERRGVEMTMRLLHALRGLLPAVPAQAPMAVGGSLAGDTYTLAPTMAELTLRELGVRAELLGFGLPAATLRAALRKLEPRLLWLSVSTVPAGDEAALASDVAGLFEAALAAGAVLVLGGRALDAGLGAALRHTAHCRSMGALADFARSFFGTAVRDLRELR